MPPPPSKAVESDVQSLDKLLEGAGLARTGHVRAGMQRRSSLKRARPDRLDKVSQTDLDGLPQTKPSCELASNRVQWHRVPGWERFEWLWHGFSTRIGGVSRAYCGDADQPDLNLGFTIDDHRETVAANRRLLAEAITGSAGTPFATIRQIHSNMVAVVDRPDAGSNRPEKADGLMTGAPGFLLGVQTADCIPVLVADRRRKAVAAFHAGWRGTAKRIVEAGIGRMRLEFGSRPEDLVAAIGPGIGLCCYIVGEDVLAEFESQFAYARELFLEVESPDPVRARHPMMFLNQRAPGHTPDKPSLHLNLAEANRRQLMAAGLRPRSIQAVGGCTSCRPELYFSHRASRGHAGRMMSVIGIQMAG